MRWDTENLVCVEPWIAASAILSVGGRTWLSYLARMKKRKKKRKKKMNDERLTETLLIRISPEMKAKLKKAAKRRGEASSALIRAGIKKELALSKKR